MNNSLPLLGITGYSGSGKTTLLEKLLPQLIKKGLRVSVIKHSHHNAHVDKEGKDSWRMKEAGSAQVIMAVSYTHLVIDTENFKIDQILVSIVKDSGVSKESA